MSLHLMQSPLHSGCVMDSTAGCLLFFILICDLQTCWLLYPYKLRWVTCLIFLQIGFIFKVFHRCLFYSTLEKCFKVQVAITSCRFFSFKMMCSADPVCFQLPLAHICIIMWELRFSFVLIEKDWKCPLQISHCVETPDLERRHHIKLIWRTVWIENSSQH